MKQIKKEIQFILQDTRIEDINFSPEVILFNKIIYSNTKTYSSGKLVLSKRNDQDSTSAYVVTYNSNLVYIESSGLVSIYVNENPNPIITRSYSYDNPNVPISIIVAVPEFPTDSTLTDYYELNDDIEVRYVTCSYGDVIF